MRSGVNMNLLAQLNAVRPTKQGPTPTELKLMKARGVQIKAAVERYQAAMQSKGWMTRRQIEEALGTTENTCEHFLKRLLNDYKLVDRRKAQTRQLTYEWRWKEE